jgi:hypothetical protein
MTMRTYEELKRAVQEATRDGRLPATPTDEERADFAAGNVAMHDYERSMREIQRSLHADPPPAWADEHARDLERAEWEGMR